MDIKLFARTVLAVALCFGIASNSLAEKIDRAAVAKAIESALEFKDKRNKAYEELRKIQYSDPKMFEEKGAALKKEMEEFNMAEIVHSAIALIKEDASGGVGFSALKLISSEFNAVRAGQEPEEGKLSEDDLRELFNEVTAKALESHINNDELTQVLWLPLMMLSHYEDYSVLKTALQRILTESESRTARGEAALQLASSAIDTSQSTRVSEEDRRQASMDVTTYSELAMKEYADVKVWGDKTVKQQLEGKLFSLNSLVPGKMLPDVEAKNLEGELDRLANYRGKVVLIDFWATWCGPCKAALPGIAVLKEELAGKPFEVISISVDEDVDDVLGYQENEQSMPWVNWHIGPDSDILTEWGVRGFPTYYVVDAEGVIKSNKYLDDSVKDQIREWVKNTAK